jgi:hypothetical protein
LRAVLIESGVGGVVVDFVDTLQPELGSERRCDRVIFIERFALALKDIDHGLCETVARMAFGFG